MTLLILETSYWLLVQSITSSKELGFRDFGILGGRPNIALQEVKSEVRKNETKQETEAMKTMKLERNSQVHIVNVILMSLLRGKW